MFFRRPSPQHMSDAELVEAYRTSRDQKFTGVLYERYSHIVYGMCMKYLKNPEDSRDAVMELYETVVFSLLKHDITNFKSWLYSVVKNHCRMQLRQAKYRPLTISQNASELEHRVDFMEKLNFVHLNNSGDNEFDAEELVGALDQLNEQQKTCLTLHYLEGKRYKEIAESMDIKIAQVKSHIQNGKRNLRLYMAKKDEADDSR